MTLFQAINTGHTTYSTMHADSVDTVINRLEGDPINIPRVMIQALDILCIQKMIIHGDKRVRRLDSIVEFIGIDAKTQDLRFNELYTWDPKNDTFRNTGKSFVLEDIMESHNWNEQQVNLELKNRKEVLEYMVEKEIDEFDIVSLIQSYYVDAVKTMKFIRKK